MIDQLVWWGSNTSCNILHNVGAERLVQDLCNDQISYLTGMGFWLLVISFIGGILKRITRKSK